MRDGGRDHGHRPGMLLRLWRFYHTCYIQDLGWASASGRRKVPSNRIGFRGRAKLIPSVGIICMVKLSAASADMLVQRFQGFASEVLMDPVHEFVSGQR